MIHSFLMYRHSERPSAVSPAMAMPMWSSTLNTLRWKEDSSDCARFRVTRTTWVSLCGRESRVIRQEQEVGRRQCIEEWARTMSPAAALPCLTASFAYST